MAHAAALDGVRFPLADVLEVRSSEGNTRRHELVVLQLRRAHDLVRVLGLIRFVLEPFRDDVVGTRGTAHWLGSNVLGSIDIWSRRPVAKTGKRMGLPGKTFCTSESFTTTTPFTNT